MRATRDPQLGKLASYAQNPTNAALCACQAENATPTTSRSYELATDEKSQESRLPPPSNSLDDIDRAWDGLSDANTHQVRRNELLNAMVLAAQAGDVETVATIVGVLRKVQP